MFIIEILRNTPTKIWVLLGVLLYIGIFYLKERTISVYRIFITPVIFFVLAVNPLYEIYGSSIKSLLTVFSIYFISLLISLFIFYHILIKIGIKVSYLPEQKRIHLSGSKFNLIAIIFAFILKYGLNIAFIMYREEFLTNILYITTFASISGLINGVFFGQLYYYYKKIKGEI